MTTKVTLRQKKISKGRQSLYLDFYPAIPHPETGEPTRREFLGLYIFEKPKTPIDKQHNTETLQIGESIRQKRENFLNKPEIYSEYEKEQLRKKELGELCFIEYFRKLANKRKASNHDNWVSALNYIEAFTKGKLKFADLNERFFEDFKEYLLTTKSKKSDKTTLSQNSTSRRNRTRKKRRIYDTFRRKNPICFFEKILSNIHPKRLVFEISSRNQNCTSP
jgi:hypothetical protein